MTMMSNGKLNPVFDSITNYLSEKRSAKTFTPAPEIMGRGQKDQTYIASNDSKAEQFLQQLSQTGYDLTQLADVIKQSGNQLIVSCAGSGKTTGLLFKVIYDTLSGELITRQNISGRDVRVMDKVLISTFLKSGADELKSRLKRMVMYFHVFDMTSALHFSTLHAEFKRSIEALGIKTNIINEKENTRCLLNVCNSLGIKYNNRPLNSEFLRELQSGLEYTRNRLDEHRYDPEIYQTLKIPPKGVELLIQEWKRERNQKSLYDFTDLQDVLYHLACIEKNPRVIDYLQSKYNYIYLDEFQDTSQVQYEILKVYAQGCHKIVAIGDDDQCIYSWRGSCSSLMTDNFVADMNASLGVLSQNYRCPSDILNPIIPSIELNKDRIPKDLVSSTDGGVLEVIENSSYAQMVETLRQRVESDYTSNPKKSIAILCRTNVDGLAPAMALDRLKIKYSVSKESMGLDGYVGGLVLGIPKLFLSNRISECRNILNTLGYGVDREVQGIIKYCKQEGISIWEISDSDLSYKDSAVLHTIRSFKEWRYGGYDFTGYSDQNEKDLAVLRAMFEYFQSSVFTRDTQFNSIIRTVIGSFIYLLDSGDYADVADFLYEVESLQERLRARVDKSNKCKITICTVHEFKGKEADFTYLWNDTQKNFPKDVNSISASDVDLEEERRVHYIACTRAKERNTILTIKNLQGKFLNEMDLSSVQLIDRDEEIAEQARLEEETKVLQKEGSELLQRLVDGDDLTDLDSAQPNLQGTAEGPVGLGRRDFSASHATVLSKAKSKKVNIEDTPRIDYSVIEE